MLAFLLPVPIVVANVFGAHWERALITVLGQGVLGASLLMLRQRDAQSVDRAGVVSALGVCLVLSVPALSNGGFGDPRTFLSVLIAGTFSLACLGITRLRVVVGGVLLTTLLLAVAEVGGLLDRMHTVELSDANIASVALSVFVLSSFVGIYLLASQMLATYRVLEQTRSELDASTAAGKVGLFKADISTESVTANAYFREIYELPVATHAELTLRLMLERSPEFARESQYWALKSLDDAVAQKARLDFPDGRVKWVQVSIVPSLDDSGQRILSGAVIDITEQFEQEQALLLREQQLREALNKFELAQSAAHFGITVYDPATGVFSGDSTMRALYDVPEDEFPVVTRELIRSRYAEDQLESLQPLIDAGKAWHRPYAALIKVRWRDGSEHFLQTQNIFQEKADGSPTFVGVAFDVTDSVNREQALVDALNDLKLTCSVTSTGLGQVNLDTGEVTANPIWRAMLGMDEEVPIDAKTVKKALPEHEQARFDDFLRKVAQSHSALSMDFDLIDAEGHSRRMRTVAAARRLENDETAIKVVQSDITDLHDQQKELALRTEQQTKLFRIVAHELRTPAATIQMLVNELDLPSKDRSELSAVTHHLLHVIDDLRIAVNPEVDIDVELGRFELSRLLQEVERQTSYLAATAGMTLRVATDKAPWGFFVSDAYRLRSALTNLIRNSALHSAGKTISLSADVDESSDHCEITFTVEDDGSGIPPQDIDRLFQPFERGNSSSAGTGVGLYLVKNWIEKLGGTVHYSPREPTGSLFTITIPTERGDKISDDSDSQATLLQARALVKDWDILIVDDDAVLRGAASRLLKKALDVNVTTAIDGSDALSSLARRDFEIIITDYMMPTMDGRQLTAALRDQGYEGMIIGLTAATIGDERLELMEAGADAVLFKPLQIEEFAAAVLDIAAIKQLYFD